jgi:hypothetical protein
MMPQAERSRNLIELQKWLSLKEKGATTAAMKAYTRNEITQLGATEKTIENYIYALEKARFIEYKHPFWRITKAGRNFLERHGA